MNEILVIFKWNLVIDGWDIFCEIALTWMSLNFTDNQSTLVQVMAWCHQATSHYLSQCWPRSPLPHGVTRPQWVKGVILEHMLEIKFISTYETSRSGEPLNNFDDKLTLVQVMAWCQQAASHYLSQYCPNLCCHMLSLNYNELKLNQSW